MLSYLTITRATHCYIIIIVRAALNGLIINNAESVITSTEKYLIIKRTLFAFRKKFATANNKRRCCSYKKIEKDP